MAPIIQSSLPLKHHTFVKIFMALNKDHNNEFLFRVYLGSKMKVMKQK